MKLIIIPVDNLVIYNNVTMHDINMDGIPSDLNAIQHDDDLGLSEEEWLGDEINTPITDIGKYQFIIDRWQVAYDLANAPPTPEELFTEAQNFKKSELKEAYFTAEENSTIEKNGRSYSANKDHISHVYIETQLAIANNESSILVFDTEENPNIVPVSFMPNVLQEMRLLSRANYVKIKNKIKQLNSATTVEEVDNIVW